MFSLLIPIFNEEGSILDTVQRAHSVLSSTGKEFEILVINDGSTDGTADILKKINLPHVRSVSHIQNIGYSAALKTGIRHSKGEVIGITDADGTYPIEEFPMLLKEMEAKQADMVVGARTKKGVKIPLIRRPAKAIVNMLANKLTGIQIPDINSGMRVFTRTLAERFMHLYPQKFSFTITITLAALTNDYIVQYTPIDYFHRKGKSTMSSGANGIKNFISFIGLIIRITTYFRPLRFFAIPSVILMTIGTGTMTYTLWSELNISDAGMLMLLTGLQIGLFGMLAEIVVRQRNAYPN